MVGTSFEAVAELEGPQEGDEFDSEFWDLAAVPPRAPGGAGEGPPTASRSQDEATLDTLEAQVAVALEEEALERERARKLEEQLRRTTAAVAELQVF